MLNVLRVARKELSGYFSSLAAFIFFGVFVAASLFVVFWVERFFARNIADMRPLFEWMPIILIFLVSALTMRMWSEERRAGTLELLMTSPTRPAHLVLGKFLACLGLVAIALALTLPLAVMTAAVGPLDWGPVFGGYLASLALASAYIAIGLFVSARTESQVVSLIVTALVCGTFYLLGSDAIASLAGNRGGELLRLLGSGSRFDSITRGVIDLRDLYYYASIFGVFMVLNLYALERLRWSEQGRRERHMRWRLAAGLVIANLAAANLWLGQIGWARADLTGGRIYSISEATRGYLRQLEEPLLIRGYFSAETHPLLAPLVPRLRDLLTEYEIAAQGRARVEIVDPLQEPELEEEANRLYDIRPVPFQTSTRYQASVTNSYFDVLVKYGDEWETLGFEDLIEIKDDPGALGIAVDLRDPEYDITRAIRKVLYAYRASGDLFERLPEPVTLQAYVSSVERLPEPLPALRDALDSLIADYEAEAGDKFSAEILDPEADEGAFAAELEQSYGLRPLAVGLFDPQTFWFHILLRSGDRVAQVPLPGELDEASLRQAIDAELKRFAPGALRTIAVHAPSGAPAMAGLGMPSPGSLSFAGLRDRLRANADVIPADLENGRVPEEADFLIVAAPQGLTKTQIFAIDQFLMKGGTVVLAASPFQPLMRGELSLARIGTGLDDWLEHHGLTVKEELVLDPQNTPFPVPVQRSIGGFMVREIQLLDYPHFVDVREDGLNDGGPTAGLSQLTLPWASPIAVADDLGERTAVRLIESSPASWTSSATNVIPDYEGFPRYGYPEGEEPGRQLLGVMLEGRFTSYFAGEPSPLAEAAQADAEAADGGEEAEAEEDGAESAGEETPVVSSVIERSPESARLVLVASSAFLSDDVIDLVSSVEGTDYAAPWTFVENVADWSLEDRGLLALRSRGGSFSRTLNPLSDGARRFWEYASYALALGGLAAVYGVSRTARAATTRRRLALLESALGG